MISNNYKNRRNQTNQILRGEQTRENRVRQRQGDTGTKAEATEHQTLKEHSDNAEKLTKTKEMTGLKYTREGETIGHWWEKSR